MLSTSILYCNNIADQQHPHSRDNKNPVSNHRQIMTPGSRAASDSQSFVLPTPTPSVSLSLQNATKPKNVLTADRNQFRVRYFGSHRCDNHSIDKGIPQKSMLDLYSSVVRRSLVLRSYFTPASINQIAEISSHGIVVAERDKFRTSSKDAPPPSDAPAPTVVTKVITPLSNIVLFGAVKLQHRTLGRSGRNQRQVGVAFVPLSCSEAVLDKNCFIQLPTKQRFLLGLPHPPLFACILRKVTANDRLECHLFVCHSSSEALRMCERMSQLRKQSTRISGGIKSVVSNNHQLPVSAGYHFKSARSSRAPSLVSTSKPSSRASHRSYQSELSSRLSGATSRFVIESDIEEEDEDNENQDCSDIPTQVSAAHRFLPNDKLSVSSHYLYRPRVQKHADNMSWNDQLSSVSSAIFSIGSKQSSLATAAASAARDYRYRSYKFADDEFSVTTPSDSTAKSINSIETAPKPSALIISKRPTHRPLTPEDDNDDDEVTDDEDVGAVDTPRNHHNGGLSLAPPQTGWSSVSNELQNNRMFARASAKAVGGACNDEAATATTTNAATSRRQFSAPAHHHFDTKPRFFGDTLVRPAEREIDTVELQTSVRSNLQADSKQKNSNGSPKQSELESCVDDDEEPAAPTSNRQRAHNVKHSTLHQFVPSNLSADQVIKHHRNSNGHLNAVELSSHNEIDHRTEPNTTNRLNSNGSHHHLHHHPMADSCPPVAIYLPACHSVGVKCFSKNSQVQHWSTIASATTPQSRSPLPLPSLSSPNVAMSKSSGQSRHEECVYCSAKSQCRECCCCSLCVDYNLPAKPRHKQQRANNGGSGDRDSNDCFECLQNDIAQQQQQRGRHQQRQRQRKDEHHLVPEQDDQDDEDDIVLDDVLEHFTKFRIHDDNQSPRQTSKTSKNVNSPAERNRVSKFPPLPSGQVTNVDRYDDTHQNQRPAKKSFLTKLKQFFGGGSSRNGQRPTRSKMWSSIRSRSIRLRGSLRFKQRQRLNNNPINSNAYTSVPPPPSVPSSRPLPIPSAHASNGKSHRTTSSKVNSSRNPLNEPAVDYISDYISPMDGIKPFFIHHPAKNTKDADGNVISISSDSGMEEYEYHSGH